jgi:tetratricopeptide (TPR) repeat protein
MKTQRLICYCLLAASLIAASACGSASGDSTPSLTGPCEIALAAHSGDAKLDREIAQIQQNIRANRQPSQTSAQIEKLGWSFVEKARASFDPGFYKLAEQCALCLESKQSAKQADKQTGKESTDRPLQSPQSLRAAALLLRGHALHNLHRFSEAEKLARELVETRSLPYDFGLLGDVLMEQGKLDEAILAYQKMMDLRPGPQAYSRAAHVRWLKGDLDGARGLMRMAAQAAGAGDSESAAWAWSRLALFELQAGDVKRAHATCDAALEMQADYAPALLARGRILLAENKAAEAVAPLERAARLNALPEYQWSLADALRAAGRNDEAQAVESKLAAQGAGNDPRTFALYLITRGQQAETALRLAEEEIKVRRDVFTLDTLAWAQAANGAHDEAWKTMQSVLAQGTEDARLFLHAAAIAAQTGNRQDALRYAGKAAKIQSTLLPSEKVRLKQLKTV